jgi:hypothetical protein
MGSEQVEAGFEVIPEPLDQKIQRRRPDLFKGRSGFKHQTNSTRCPGVQIDLTRSYFEYIKGFDRLGRNPGFIRVTHCLFVNNMKLRSSHYHQADRYLLDIYQVFEMSNLTCSGYCSSLTEPDPALMFFSPDLNPIPDRVKLRLDETDPMYRNVGRDTDQVRVQPAQSPLLIMVEKSFQ